MASELESHLLAQQENIDQHFWHRLRWRAVRSYLPADEAIQVVDVGAGAGLLGTYLQRDRPAAAYRFVEPIGSLRVKLTEAYGAGADAMDEPNYGGARYVTLLDVLEHQEDDRAFLESLLAKMAPGSLLLLTVPALPALWSGWDEALGHYRRYTKSSLKKVIKDLPLEVEELSYLFPEMLMPAYIRAKRSKSKVGGEVDSEFHLPPRLINTSIYSLGMVSLRLRRWWPAGSSLFLVARVTP